MYNAEFWARYVRLLEPSKPDQAAEAVRRCARVHCARQPDAQLFAARFHERKGDPAAAAQALETVTGSLAPGLLSAVLAHANFERRRVRGPFPFMQQVPDLPVLQALLGNPFIRVLVHI